MILPRPELPRYKTILPFSKKEIEYRPYTTKEEKILMMAAASENMQDCIEASYQVLELCSNADVRKMAGVDIEWLFFKLRSASVSNICDIIFEVDCDNEACEKTVKGSINLDNVEVKNLEAIQDNYKSTKDGWIIPFTDKIGVILNPVDNVNGHDSDDYVWDCLNCVYKGDEVVYKDELDKDEFIEWINMFTRKEKAKLEEFFNSNPYTYINFKHKCKTCDKEYIVELRNIIDFFA